MGLKMAKEIAEKKGALNVLQNLVRDGDLSVDIAASRAGMTVTEFEKTMASEGLSA